MLVPWPWPKTHTCTCELRRHLSQMTDTLRCATLSSLLPSSCCVSFAIAHRFMHMRLPFFRSVSWVCAEYWEPLKLHTQNQQQHNDDASKKKCSSPEQIQCHQGIKSSIYVGLVNGSTGTHSAARTRIHTLAPWHRFIFHFGFIVGYINSKELYFANNILFCLSFFIIAIAAECTEPHKLCTE